MESTKKKCMFITAGLAAIIFLLCGCAKVEKEGTCGENLTWVYAENVLAISGIGDMLFEEEVPWGIWCEEDIQRVVIEEGCTSVDDFAFSGCDCLTEVVLPDSLQSIGEDAFDSCESLTQIALPDTIQYIGEFAFSNCIALEKITLPE